MSSPRVLITGGAGFIGNHLARALLAAGREVVVIDDLSTGRHSNVADLEGRPGFRLYVDTVRNRDLMERLMHECGTVFHLASSVGVRLIMEEPVRTIDNIYQSTEVVLGLARRYRNRVLLTSTSEVYGKSADIPFREDGDRLEGPTDKHRWAYACAKALDEFLALAHHKETQLPVTVVRLFNTVGPRQTGQYGMVLPRFVAAALAGAPMEVHGDGSQSRCFCHVLDVVDALRALIEEPKACGQVINIGATDEISILDLAKRVKARLGSASEVRMIPYAEAYGPGFEDMQRRLPSIEKVKRLVGWSPKRSLDTIVDDIAADQRTGAR